MSYSWLEEAILGCLWVAGVLSARRLPKGVLRVSLREEYTDLGYRLGNPSLARFTQLTDSPNFRKT